MSGYHASLKRRRPPLVETVINGLVGKFEILSGLSSKIPSNRFIAVAVILPIIKLSIPEKNQEDVVCTLIESASLQDIIRIAGISGDAANRLLGELEQGSFPILSNPNNPSDILDNIAALPPANQGPVLAAIVLNSKLKAHAKHDSPEIITEVGKILNLIGKSIPNNWQVAVVEALVSYADAGKMELALQKIIALGENLNPESIKQAVLSANPQPTTAEGAATAMDQKGLLKRFTALSGCPEEKVAALLNLWPAIEVSIAAVYIDFVVNSLALFAETDKMPLALKKIIESGDFSCQAIKENILAANAENPVAPQPTTAEGAATATAAGKALTPLTVG